METGESTRGTKALMLFGLVTLLEGVSLCGERLVDVFALSAADTLSPDEMFDARPFLRVRFDPTAVRWNDALYRRTDLKSAPFYANDPRVTIRASAAELPDVLARRNELHGAHLAVDGVSVAGTFTGGGDDMLGVMKGAGHAHRVFGRIAGGGPGGETLWVGVIATGENAQQALEARTSFEGTLVSPRELEGLYDLFGKPAGMYEGKGFLLLDGESAPPPGSVERLVPLGPTNNLFVHIPEGADLGTTPAEGTLSAPIDDPVPRMSLRMMLMGVRTQHEAYRPLRILLVGTAAQFRRSPAAPFTIHPGGGGLILLGLASSVTALAWGARRDRAEEGKLRFELVIAVLEVLILVVPIVWFLARNTDRPPAIAISAAASSSVIYEPASQPPPPAPASAAPAESVTNEHPTTSMPRCAPSPTCARRRCFARSPRRRARSPQRVARS